MTPNGLAGSVVTVEAHIAPGLPSFHLVGLPDASLQESVNRVRAACQSMGLSLPASRITVNLSPSSLPKHGSGFDLPIALAVLAAAGEIDSESISSALHIGELGLDGSVRKVPSLLPMLAVARTAQVPSAMVPSRSISEAKLIRGIGITGVSYLGEALRHHGSLRHFPEPVDEWGFAPNESESTPKPDLSDLIGHQGDVLALAIAASGGHHIAFVGPPGNGKTMLAERLPGILPSLDDESAMAAASIRSILGSFSGKLEYTPPFEAPHHTVSMAALIGGGSGQPRPGAISRAHMGVLFLDEATEFPRRHLDAMRQPLEAGFVEISRVHGVVRYPSRFQLALAFNPCPCGNFGSMKRACTCGSASRMRYLNRVSGPLWDRVDIRSWVQSPDTTSLFAAGSVGESSEHWKVRVSAARKRSLNRLAGSGRSLNSELTIEDLRTEFAPKFSLIRPVVAMLEKGQLSIRGFVRLLRLAWTCADFFDSPIPTKESLELAMELHRNPLSAN